MTNPRVSPFSSGLGRKKSYRVCEYEIEYDKKYVLTASDPTDSSGHERVDMKMQPVLPARPCVP